ncbi:unnamed protein product [Ceratitis capitata]|uniref:(Mediterranean fruit fly) hypothetical protein n=1 Tax=Ceratitis capitata TaxID=7213 RepID=A0A811UHY1_CERCA|nr:unnamed protein product [Ceratitis capitata]
MYNKQRQSDKSSTLSTQTCCLSKFNLHFNKAKKNCVAIKKIDRVNVQSSKTHHMPGINVVNGRRDVCEYLSNTYAHSHTQKKTGRIGSKARHTQTSTTTAGVLAEK